MHSVNLDRNDAMDHVFAFVKWKKTHPNFGFYGKSAIVSENMFAPDSVLSFLPVQRIASQAAQSVLTVNFGSIK